MHPPNTAHPHAKATGSVFRRHPQVANHAVRPRFDHVWDCSRLFLRRVHYARPRRTLSHCPGRRRAREATEPASGVP